MTSLLAVMFSLSAHATLYQFNYPDSGAIPQSGTTFSTEQTVSGLPDYVTSVELILTFNDSSSLTGDSTGIQGLLDLGTGTGSPYVSFSPTPTSSSGAERIYEVTFSGTQPAGFNGLNPNDTWALVLWDNSSTGIENGLVSGTLDITTVPEKENEALALFGIIVISMMAARRHNNLRLEKQPEPQIF
jgi:hypothetical protein